jgi:hypothetical protein
MLFDDYGVWSCPGAHRAVDEFFTGTNATPMVLSTGQCFVRRTCSKVPSNAEIQALSSELRVVLTAFFWQGRTEAQVLIILGVFSGRVTEGWVWSREGHRATIQTLGLVAAGCQTY